MYMIRNKYIFIFVLTIAYIVLITFGGIRLSIQLGSSACVKMIKESESEKLYYDYIKKNYNLIERSN